MVRLYNPSIDGVESINGLTGDITLAAGTNISLVTVGNTITINASVGANWSLTGNAGTTVGTNFLGTTDNVALMFKMNNIQAGLISTGASGERNTYFGSQAGLTRTTGRSNSMFGHGAGANVTTGNRNSFFGHQSGAGTASSTATDNSFFGQSIATGITSGQFNSILGSNNANTFTTASFNTIIGAQITGLSASLANNIILADGAGSIRAQWASTGALTLTPYGAGTFTGTPTFTLQVDASGNVIEGAVTGGAVLTSTYVGYGSGANLLTGTSDFTYTTPNTGSKLLTLNSISSIFIPNQTSFSGSMAFGTGLINLNHVALDDGFRNTTLGIGAGDALTTAQDVTFIGYNAGHSTTVATYNTAMGSLALQSGTGGAVNNFNSAFGYQAIGVANANGNSAFGYQAIGTGNAGNLNSAFGFISLMKTTGSENSAYGGYSLQLVTSGYANTSFGTYSGFNLTTGYLNTFVGWDTGLGITTGNSNTIIGSSVTGLTSSLANNVIIADGDGNIRLRDTGGDMTISSTLRNKVFVSPNASTPVSVTNQDSNTRYTNEGASAEIVFNLPTAVTGLTYTFIVEDSDGLKAVANTGDTIRLAGVVSVTAGYAESLVIGSSITLVAINATEWIATASVGSWTVI